MSNQEAELIRLTSIETGRAVLFLAPLAIVAWMDREPRMEELVAIAGHHAEERCGEQLGCLSEEARQFFYFHFVYQKPSSSLVAKTLALLAAHLEEIPRVDAAYMTRQLESASEEVARSTGAGILRNGISAREGNAIRQMMAFLRPRNEATARELALTLGLNDRRGDNQ